MLTGENGTLTKAEEAKNNTEKAGAKEKLQMEVLGSYDNDGKLDSNNLKSNILEHIPDTTVDGETFPITVTVEGQVFTVEANGNIKWAGSVVNGGIKAEDIAKEPATFYGAEVRGYSVNAIASDEVKNAVTTWRIFYAGKEPNGMEDNIYLIADDYIRGTEAPDGKNGSKIYENPGYINSEFRLSFNNVYRDYEGSSWILGQTEGKDNSLAKGWLDKYFNYTPDNGVTYPHRTSTNENIRAIAYMMDTEQWSSYAGEKAKYAIGGVPIEMFCASYKESHAGSNISCDVINGGGYDNSYLYDLLSDCNQIYIKKESEKTAGMWLAAPMYSNQSYTNIAIAYNNNHVAGNNHDYNYAGLRPLVCLNAGVKLEKVSDRIYSIK